MMEGVFKNKFENNFSIIENSSTMKKYATSMKNLKTSTKSFKQGIKQEYFSWKYENHIINTQGLYNTYTTYENKVMRKHQIMWVYKSHVKSIIMNIGNEDQSEIPFKKYESHQNFNFH